MLNYIGSKHRLSSWLLEEITNVVGNLDDKIFCDLFAGTGVVGRTFKNRVKKVISNDLEYYSFVLNKNYIENNKPINNKDKLIEELNNLSLRSDGFIYNNYCLGSSSNRQYFTDSNGKKIDTIRKKIEEWKESKYIDSSTYYFLLASLIESADKVANTASVYGSFLKNIKKTANQDLVIESSDFVMTNHKNQVFNQDSNELIKNISGDILYLDPPYNERQYSLNYHILNTITKYKNFSPKGKAGVPNYNRSKYCSRIYIQNTFEELIKNAKFKYIFLSYNNEGLIKEKTIKNIMIKYGKYQLIKKSYKRFKADKTENRNHKANSTFEYLHVLIKD
jgi:adenine-specific DNA-methyltransferase